jgi:3-phenylpropionate/trans-cinnamate dioxygenase ferredoxin subunit
MSDLTTQGLHTLGPSDTITPGSVVPHYLADRKLRISVARIGGHLYAFDDLCTCAPPPCPLSSGLLIGTTITCQCHGSQFDIVTGAAITGPATEPLTVYDVHEAEGNIHVRA